MCTLQFTHRQVFSFGQQAFTLSSAISSDLQSLNLVSSHLDKYLIEVLAGKSLLDFLRGTLREDPAFVEEEDAITDFFDIFHIVRGVEDGGGAFSLESENEFADLVSYIGIKGGRWFVEEEKFGIVEKGLGQVYPRAFASGQAAGYALTQMGDSEHVEKLLNLVYGVLYAVEPGEDPQVLPDLEIGWEVGVGGAEVRSLENVDPVLLEIPAEDGDSALVWNGEAENHVHHGGFSRPIYAKKPDDLASPDLEVQVIDRNELPEALGDIPDLKEWFRHCKRGSRRELMLSGEELGSDRIGYLLRIGLSLG